jgi:hypothetical protein
MYGPEFAVNPGVGMISFKCPAASGATATNADITTTWEIWNDLPGTSGSNPVTGNSDKIGWETLKEVTDEAANNHYMDAGAENEWEDITRGLSKARLKVTVTATGGAVTEAHVNNIIATVGGTGTTITHDIVNNAVTNKALVEAYSGQPQAGSIGGIGADPS